MIIRKEKSMCKSATCLETIKKTKGKGGMTPAQIKLAEAQAEDYADMKQEIKSIKEDLSEVKKELAGMGGKLDLLISQSQNKPFLQVVKDLIGCRGFWIVLALLIIGYFGLNISDLKGILGG